MYFMLSLTMLPLINRYVGSQKKRKKIEKKIKKSKMSVILLMTQIQTETSDNV